MARFTKFFRSKTNSATTAPASTEAPASTTAEMTIPLVAEETFIEHSEPKGDPEQDALPRASSNLVQLSRQDRFGEGYRTGYAYHDTDVERMQVERIKAEIRQAAEDEVSILRQKIANLDMEIEALGDNPNYGVTLRKLRAQRHSLQDDLMRLQEQLLLVEGNSGPAEKPVSSYQAGFKQGYKKRLQEVLFLNQYKG